MVERVFRFLITVVLVCLLAFLILWVLGEMGIMLPPMVIVCVKVLAVLIILLTAWRFFGAYLGGWWGPMRP